MTDRRKLTAADKVQIALGRYGPLNTGRPMTPLKALAAKWDIKQESTVHNAIKWAFTQGLVEFRVVPEEDVTERALREPERSHDLERQLLNRFDKLQAARVIDALSTASSSSDHRRVGDDVHRVLGEVMGRYIATGAVFRDGDRIGFGSGRGVFHAIDAIGIAELRVRDVELMALSGNMQPTHHAGLRNTPLDADHHVGLMGSRFSSEVALRTISHPIAYEPGRLAEAREETWLGADRWRSPTLALVGVGSLGPGHRFYDEINVPEARRDLALQPIGDLLKRLDRLSKEVADPVAGDHFYYPVADISNRLFYVRPPVGKVVPTAIEGKITELVEQVNSRLLTISEEQLKEIGTILLVAGGLSKARALFQLLTTSSYNVRVLVTDVRAAQQIVRWASRTSVG